jgi:hypothetical protein
MPAGDPEEFQRVADQLCEVTEALRDVDLNLLLDDEVRAVLDAKDEFSELTLKYRRSHRAGTDEDTKGGEGPQ